MVQKLLGRSWYRVEVLSAHLLSPDCWIISSQVTSGSPTHFQVSWGTCLLDNLINSQVPCPSCELENLTPGLNLCCYSIAIFSYLLFFAMSPLEGVSWRKWFPHTSKSCCNPPLLFFALSLEQVVCPYILFSRRKQGRRYSHCANRRVVEDQSSFFVFVAQNGDSPNSLLAAVPPSPDLSEWNG